MRIAYLVNQYPHVSHSFIRREIVALEACGFHVERFSIRPSGADLVDEADRAERDKTEVLLQRGVRRLALALLLTALIRPLRWLKAASAATRLGRRSERGVLRHVAYLAEACLLASRLRETAAQHLHAHFGTNSTTVALLTHLLCGIPYSFTVHGPEEFDRPEALSLGNKIAKAAFVVAISDYGRSQLYRWASPADWHKIHVVRCGVDEAFLDGERAHVPEAPRLVCVGRLCEQKGQMLLLEAAERIARAGVPFELTLAGDGPMRAAVEREIHRRRLKDCVRITGWLSNRQVREEIRMARVLVLPSFAEGLPVVIMEALALGRPVVSTYVAGIPELVQPGVNGWLVPAGNAAALADALAEALAVPASVLAKLGGAGAARVAAQHNSRTEAARLAEHLAGGLLPTAVRQPYASSSSRIDGPVEIGIS
jgi:glycosyltransferase involved in cell wall biosynthesis